LNTGLPKLPKRTRPRLGHHPSSHPGSWIDASRAPFAIRISWRTIALGIVMACGLVNAASTEPVPHLKDHTDWRWPAGTEVLSFDNVEGVILLTARLHGPSGRDSSATLAVDTGAGFLALDRDVAQILGISDSTDGNGTLDYADHPLNRLELGTLELDQVSPVLTLHASMIREVTDRPVAGLLGERIFADRGLWIDYRDQRVAFVPVPPDPLGGSRSESEGRASSRSPIDSGAKAAKLRSAGRKSRVAASRALFSGIMSASAIAVPFDLEGDGKVLVRVRVSNPLPPRHSPWLTFIVDTGATKCVLFTEAVHDLVPGAREWSSLLGLSAPTLFGISDARVVRIPSTELETEASGSREKSPRAVVEGGRLAVSDVDAVVIRTDLAAALARAVRRPVHGLLGYSFLKRYRIAFDYPHRVMWLDPLPANWENRSYEYTHVGIQIERRGTAMSIVGVVEDSPAARAGIRRGDQVVSVDGRPVGDFDVVSLSRHLEGPPGTRVMLMVRRDGTERSYSLARRRLL
jgi:hypothetical protein